MNPTWGPIALELEFLLLREVAGVTALGFETLGLPIGPIVVPFGGFICRIL